MILKQHRKNIHSQNGEDGVIEKIFEVLAIEGGYICEFGASDGISLSNTYNLFKNNPNFSPILIEADKARYAEMVSNFSHIKNKYLFNESVSVKDESSLDSLLSTIPGLKNNFKLLSIDVDGLDYEIWENFRNFRPLVVIIEVNSSYPPAQKVYPCVPSGASAGIMNELGEKKGYKLVCHTGNLFFVVEELFPLLEIEDNSLEALFLRNWLR